MVTMPPSAKTSCYYSLYPAEMGSDPQMVGEKCSKSCMLLVPAKWKREVKTVVGAGWICTLVCFLRSGGREFWELLPSAVPCWLWGILKLYLILQFIWT